MSASIEIAGRRIAHDAPCFVIAEVGVNHNGERALAKELVDVALQAGADAVKFQTFRASALAAATAAKASYQRQSTGEGGSQLAMLEKLELSYDTFADLAAYSRSRNIVFLSTPFDEESVDFLDEIAVPAFKVASGDITNALLLERIAGKGKPILLSTGTASIGEVDDAVQTILASGNTELALLQCVSSYPASPADVNLRAIETLRRTFEVPVGYSDHTTGITIAIAAAALGACIVEKHFTTSRALSGPDHSMSLEPGELAEMVRAIRDAQSALGTGIKRPVAAERENTLLGRRSLVASRDLQPGTVITRECLTARRPGTGLSPMMLRYVLGRTPREVIREGEQIVLSRLT